ncbi:MAG: hypothetical protein N3E52_01205 [Candidatus Bathyarchaeota archaeon]|nr:hypothetical protein [Candidatus Bathyarchaeota archaeon]
MDKFDETLLNVIEEVFLCTLGANSTRLIYNYLESKALAKSKIPCRIDRFSEELRKLLGDNEKSILNPAYLLEKAIAQRLCAKLGLKMQLNPSIAFAEFIGKLKEEHLKLNLK